MRKKVLILGAKGMAGHVISLYLDSLDKYDLTLVAREKIKSERALTEAIDLETEEGFTRIKDLTRCGTYDIIINCVGLLVKDSSQSPSRAIFLNSYLPRVLGEQIKETKTKLIHLSTDCVFKGNKFSGNYSADAVPDETTPYGLSKMAGEMKDYQNVLTLRTSIIGPELKQNGTGLFDWFMKQTGTVQGYASVVWNGITTPELAKGIVHYIDSFREGLINFTPEYSISKYELLWIINHRFNRNSTLKEDYTIKQDKTLAPNHYFKFPDNYNIMIKDMKDFIEGYQEIVPEYNRYL